MQQLFVDLLQKLQEDLAREEQTIARLVEDLDRLTVLGRNSKQPGSEATKLQAKMPLLEIVIEGL